MPPDAPTTAQAEPTAAVRPWYRSTWFLALTGGLAVYVGLQFVGLIAVVLLVGDHTRDRDARIGGGVLIFWWTFAVASTRASGFGPLPYVGFALLAIASVFLVRGALDRRGLPWGARWGVTVLAALAVVLGVLQLVPYGFRSPTVDSGRAVELVAEKRAADAQDEDIAATRALAELGRVLVTQRPYWVVAVFEPSSAKAETPDGNPCFSRAQAYVVDGVDGRITRADKIVEPDDDEPCLPINEDTADDLVDLVRV
jgi:hypothetical protein